MGDLETLAFVYPLTGENVFGEALLRDLLDFTHSRSFSETLVGLRWHFLLGTIPLDFTSLETFREVHTQACDAIEKQWKTTCATFGIGCSPFSPAPEVGATSPKPSRTVARVPFVRHRKLTKFDSSSDDQDDNDAEARGASASVFPHEGEDPARGIVLPAVTADQGASDCVNASGAASEAAGGGPRVPPLVQPENPLCPSSDSRYDLEYRMETVRKEIRKDVERLYWDLPLFDDPQTKKDIETILLVYCLTEGRRYKQGMHEIVAFLYYIGHRDRTVLSVDESPACGPLPLGVASTVGETRGAALPTPFEREKLEAWRELCQRISAKTSQTAYTHALFKQVMSGDDAGGGGGFGLEGWYYSPVELTTRHLSGGDGSGCGRDLSSEQTGIVVAAERVQQDLLVRHDAPLQHRLDSDYGIQGAAYLIRWLRLLFLREFTLEQCVVLWSGFFAEMRMCRLRSTSFDLLSSLPLYTATAMLLSVRQSLMVDSTRALQQLMRFPTVTDIRSLLSTAVRMSSDPLLHVYSKTTSQSSLATSVSQSGLAGTAPTSSANGNSTASFGGEHLPPANASAAASDVMIRQGERLSHIVSGLERYWFPPPDSATTAEEKSRLLDEYVQAIAELKRVRDVLLFGIDG